MEKKFNKESSKKLIKHLQKFGAGDLEVVKKLIEKGADPNYISEKDNYNQTYILWFSPARDNLEIVKYLVSNGADLNLIHQGDTAVKTALRHGRFDIVKYLLSKKARFDPDDFSDISTIGIKSDELYSFINYLIKKGININAKDFSGESILFKAIDGEQLKLIQLLLNTEIDVNQKNGMGLTPLAYMYEQEIDNKDIETLLLKHGAKK